MAARVFDGDEPVPGNQSTDLLTVWRKLHVEFDTMEAAPYGEPFDNVTGTSSSIDANGLWVQGRPDWPEDSLEGGVLDPRDEVPPAGEAPNYLTHGQTWEVWWNFGDETGYFVGVETDYSDDSFDNDQDGLADDDDPEGEVWELTPDPESNAPFAINTDDPEWLSDHGLSPPSDPNAVDGMNGYYREAYIECVAVPPEANPTSDFAWQRNLGLEEEPATFDQEQSEAYWAACVQWCYDCPAREYALDPCPTHGRKFYWSTDDDPEFEGVPEPGDVPGQNRACTRGKSNAIPGTASKIHTAVCHDTVFKTLLRTVAHEVGHLLGLRHAEHVEPINDDDNGIMGWDKPGGMTGEPCWHDWAVTWKTQLEPIMRHAFSPNNLNQLRSKSNPWGG